MRITYSSEDIKTQVTEALGPGKDYTVKTNKRQDMALSARITDGRTVFTFNPCKIHRTAKLEELITSCQRDLNGGRE